MWYAYTLGEVARKFVWVLVTGLLVPGLVLARPSVIYVDDDAPVGGDGRSWETAYRYLQDTLSPGGLPRDTEIRVAQGVYLPDCNEAIPEGSGNREKSFLLETPLHLKGGFAGREAADPNAWDPNYYETILSGDLAGNDVPVSSARELLSEPTRSDNARHVVVVSGEPQHPRIYPRLPDFLIEGLVITGGNAADDEYARHDEEKGGGLLLKGVSSTTIRHCEFHGNAAIRGGGLASVRENMLLVNSSRFSVNGAYSGGGMYCADMPLDIEAHFTGCIFHDNWGFETGGGIYSGWAWIRLSGIHLLDNFSGGGGGAIYSRYSYLAVLDSFVNGNVAGEVGGGVVGAGNNIIISNTQFKSNNCKGPHGGGALWTTYSNAIFSNCLFAGNNTKSHGGVMNHWKSDVRVNNCTAHGNRAPNGRFLSNVPMDWSPAGMVKSLSLHSGLFNKSTLPSISLVTIDNSIIDNGGDEFLLELENFQDLVEVRYSNIVDSNRPPSYYGDGTVLWGPDVLSVDPCFAEPGFWDSNGTPGDPSDDMFVEGDYHLQSQAGRWEPVSGSWIRDDVTSPCIDAGDLYAPVEFEPFPNGGVVNMGAYGGTVEASKSYFGEPPCETIMAGDINGDCRVDKRDLEILVRNWTEESDD